MEEIRLWKTVPGEGLSSIDPVPEVDSEIELEELLVAHPELLEDGLTLVGRQTPAAGGRLDLLGVASDGRLVIFELKRGTLGRDAVAQVLDYASEFSAMDVETLVERIQTRSGDGGVERIEDFRVWYEENFGDLQGLRPVRIALVGLGANETALRIAGFLAEGGHAIEVITFYGFRDGKSTLLARRVPIQPTPEGGVTLTKAAKWERVRRHVGECGMEHLFDTVRGALLEQLPGGVYEDPLNYGVSLKLNVLGGSGIRGPRHYFGIYAGYTEEGGSIDISLGGILRERHTDDYKRLEGDARNLEGGVRWIKWLGGNAISVDSEKAWRLVKGPLCEFAAAVAKKWEQYRNTPPE